MTAAESNLIDTRLDAILQNAMEETSESVLLVNPSREAVTRLVKIAAARDTGPTVRVLADRRILKDAMEDFIVASNAADLVESTRLELRSTADDGAENSLLVTPTSVVALVETGSSVGGLTTDNDEFIEDAYATYMTVFEAAEDFSMRTPPLSRVLETLGTEIGTQAEEDFATVLESLDTARGDGGGLDEVSISLLVAAKNEVLLYDISRWGEDVGIASKATFSRTKTRLEDVGIIDTEKVPIDVGRPRLRLKFGDDRLIGVDGSELAGVVQEILD